MNLPLHNFFLLNAPAADLLLQGHSKPALVALSVVVAALTSALALQMAVIARDAPTAGLRGSALGLGSLSLGAGVWAMHFIGMLSFEICTPVHYLPWPTLGSMVPSLGAAAVALQLLARPRVSWNQLLAGGVLVGAGIGLMHYGGMAALDMPVALRYDPAWFALSIATAVVLAVLALWIRFGLAQRRALAERDALVLSALVMGAAISGMHYTAMEAARFIGRAAPGYVGDEAQNAALAIGIALTTLVIGALAVAVNAALRFRLLFLTLQQSEARLQATLAERRKIEVALADSEQQHRSLISNIPGVAFRGEYDPVRAQTRLVFVSGACEQLTGWQVSDFLDGRVDYPSLVHADDRARVLDYARRRLDQRGTYRIEYRVCVRGGGDRWVAETGTLTRGYPDGLERVDGIVLDVTESRLRNAEFEGTVTALRRGVAVIEFDLQGRILAVNGRFLELTGYAEGDLLGQPHAVLTRLPDSEERRQERQRHWDALRRGEYRTAEFRMVGKDGRELWVRANYNPLFDADGLPCRSLTFVTDLSERRAMEVDLREAKERAEQAAAAKSTFLANMSHEIRTPMNAVIGFSEVVLEGELQSRQREHVTTINRAARSLLALLNDILDTAKLDHGSIELEAHDFSLREVCADLLATLRLDAEGKGLYLRLDYPDNVEDCYVGDALRVQQVLLNLVGNAVKFTERGGVTLSVTHGAEGVEMAVTDTGIGIAPERLERIFEPFAQADASMTRRFGGTGLGTTIARQLAELMGGRIRVQSTPGEGSRFVLTLPLPAGQAQRRNAHQFARQLPPLRILVADDVPINLQLLEIRLARQGHRVATAQDGEEALARIAAEAFDVVLMDVQMPVLDGLGATRRLREREQAAGLPRLPVIALTASAMTEDRRLTEAAGMDGFAVKPVDQGALLDEIARVLELGTDATGGTGDDTVTDTFDGSGSFGGMAPPAAAAAAQPVDWQAAVQRWGSAEVHVRALRHFLRDALHGWQDLPGNAMQAAGQAHRLRGAAANLGLPAVVDSARAVEQAPHDPAAWAALQRALRAAMDSLVPDGVAAAQSSSRDLPATELSQLHNALSRGELDEAALAAVCAALPALASQALENAVAQFDFEHAARLTAALLETSREPA